MLTMRDVRELGTATWNMGGRYRELTESEWETLLQIIERQQEALNRIKEHAYHGAFVGMHLDGDVVYNIVCNALLPEE